MKARKKITRTGNIKSIGLSLFVGLLILVSGCLKDDTWELDEVDDTIDVPFELAAPIAKGEISVYEVINDWDVIDTTKFRFDADSLLFFEELVDFEVKEFIDVEFTNQDTVITFLASNLPFDVVLPAGANIQPDTFDVVFELKVNGGELYRAIFEGGVFGVQGVTGFGEIPGIHEKYTIVIPDLNKDGVRFEHTFDGDNFSGDKLFNLEGYELKFDRDEPGSSIKVKIVYAVVNNTSLPVALDVSKPLTFTMRLNDVEPEYIEGYLDPEYFLEKTEEVNLPLLSPDYLQDSTVFFYDPKVEIELVNNVGVPFGVKFNELKVVNTVTKESTDLDYEKDVINLEPATVEFFGENISVTPATQTEIITRENSSIHTILNRVYNKAVVSYQLIANPDGKPEVDNFIKISEGVQMNIKTRTVIPLWARVDSYWFNDTIDFDVQSELIDDIEEDTASLNQLDSLELILNINNRFPLELCAQLYLIDGDNNMIDSLLTDSDTKLLEAAPVNGEGIPTDETKSKVVLSYSGDKLEKWKTGKKIVFDIKASSTENKFVKVYANQGVSYSLGFYTKANVTDELLDSNE